ncbi:MAG: DNA primase [bacterium]
MAPNNGIKEEILQRVDILDLVSEYVDLKKAGRRYKGLCPFHPEKTPSFHVDKEKQFFYCFGCHTGGDAFTFLMKKEGITFMEAMEHLARRCGISIPAAQGNKGDIHASERQQIFEINSHAQRYFEKRLWSGKGGIEYLRSRGLEDDLIKRFGLGYAIDSWDGLFSHMKRHFSTQMLLMAGLVCPRQSGTGFYDRFRNRVIFPIRTMYGDICGFGGRSINAADEGPKYLNSPETPAYSKGQILYGLDYAKEAIRQTGQAIVVEGYMDLLTLHQAGFTNVVAALGTAMTVYHVRALKRYATEVILVFDSDMAGVKAAQRGTEIFCEEGIQARVATLPSGKDPDSLVRESGREGFTRAIDQAQPIIDFLLKSHGLLGGEVMVQEKSEKIDQIIHFLARMRNPLERDGNIRYTAQRLGVSEEAMRERLRQVQGPTKGRQVRSSLRPQDFSPPSRRECVERLFIKLAFELGSPSSAMLQNVDVSDFRNPDLRELAGMILDHWRQGITVEPRAFLMEVDSEKKKDLISQVMIGTEAFEDTDQAVRDFLKGLRQGRIYEQLNEIRKKLDSTALSREEENLLLSEYRRLKMDACALEGA